MPFSSWADKLTGLRFSREPASVAAIAILFEGRRRIRRRPSNALGGFAPPHVAAGSAIATPHRRPNRLVPSGPRAVTAARQQAARPDKA